MLLQSGPTLRTAAQEGSKLRLESVAICMGHVGENGKAGFAVSARTVGHISS